jgi:hypothetical protein
MRRKLEEIMEDLKHKRVQESKEWFQKPKTPDRPEHSAGWVAKPDWTGSSWSGERAAGRNWGGGRER